MPIIYIVSSSALSVENAWTISREFDVMLHHNVDTWHVGLAVALFLKVTLNKK